MKKQNYKVTCRQKTLNRMVRGAGIIVCALLMIILCACGAAGDAAVQPQTAEEIITIEPSATATPAILPTPMPTAIATTQPEPTPRPAPEPAQTFVGQVVCIANDSVNIREGAGTVAPVLGTFPGGESADVIAYDDDAWVYIVYEGITGYVSRDYTVIRSKPDVAVPMGDWAAILVNPTHLLSDGFVVTLADFEGGQVDARILEICEHMFADAKEDGVDFKLVDAYRSYDTQSAQYQKKVDSYIAKGYSRPDAEVKAATITARPNTSEHQTGLALDIVTPSYTRRDKGFASTRAYKWLDANAHNYGFTMRYKAEKGDITKVIYEPWHWRFVGVDAATDMKQSGECYEEYLGMVD